MERLNDVTITKVYEGKSGESQYGHWQAYNFYIDDPDWKDIKFSYFGGDNKPTPEQGRKGSLEFEVEEKGEYTNYVVKKLISTATKPKPVPTSTPKSSNGKTGPYIDHGKCMIEMMKMADKPDGIDKDQLKDYLDIFKRGVAYMVDESPVKRTPKPEPQDEQPPDEIYDPDAVDDSEIPF